MGKKASRNIYYKTYLLVGVVIAAFFPHNALQHYYYDVLHIDKTVTFFGYTFFIKDIFPFYDAPETGFYGNVVRYDLQEYVFTLSERVIMLAMAIGWYISIRGFNMFASELPGRRFERMPWILLLLIGLFAYELLDYVFFAAQTAWELQALVFYVLLTIIIFHGDRKPNA